MKRSKPYHPNHLVAHSSRTRLAPGGMLIALNRIGKNERGACLTKMRKTASTDKQPAS